MLVTDLKQTHFDEACELFAVSYSRLCEAAPELDESNANKDEIIPMLKGCLEKHPGVAAFENGKMSAYTTCFYVDFYGDWMQEYWLDPMTVICI